MAFERLRNGYLEKVNFIGDSNLTILLRDYQTSSTYVHIHRQTHKHIEPQTHTKTHTLSHRHTDTQTHSHT